MNGTPLRFVINPVGAELEAALACEADVFLDAYGNTAEEWADEYDPYVDQTGFMTVLDETGLALATTRFIAPGPAGLKTLNDVAREPWGVDGARSARSIGIDPERTWDVATIATRRIPGRNVLCSAALYHGIVTMAQADGMDSIVMILDDRARRLLMACGVRPHVLPGTFEGDYLGSAKSTPLGARIDYLAEEQRRTDADAYRLIYQGVGLDGIELPTDWTWQRNPVPTTRTPIPA